MATQSFLDPDAPVIVREGERLSGLSTDDLIQEVQDADAKFANLMELDNGMWRCNLQERNEFGKYYHEFGTAPTMRQAIMVALHNMYYYRESKGKGGQTFNRHVNRDFNKDIDPTTI